MAAGGMVMKVLGEERAECRLMGREVPLWRRWRALGALLSAEGVWEGRPAEARGEADGTLGRDSAAQQRDSQLWQLRP